METAPEVHEVQAMAAASGVPINAALLRAGISKVTYWRWTRRAMVPSTATIRRVKTAIQELAAA